MDGDFGSNQPAFSSETLSGETQKSPPEPPVFHPLDRRVVRLWRITNTIGLGILTLMVSAVLAVFATGFPKFVAVVPFGVGLVLLLSVFYIIWYPPRAYKAWGYRIDSKVIEARRGVIFLSTHLLPLNRLQHVDIHRGPLERANGLSSLLLHTAGSQAATLVIPGLDQHEAQRLRDHLVEIGGDDAV